MGPLLLPGQSLLRRAGVGSGLVLLVSAGFVAPTARATEILNISDLSVEEDLRREPFTLTRPLTLHIYCEGAGDGGDDEMYAYGWILNAGSREVVWSLNPQRANRNGDRYVFDADVSLPAGDYIAGYAAFGTWRAKQRIIKIMGKEIARIEVDRSKQRRVLREAKRWQLRLETRSSSDESAVKTRQLPEATDRRVIVQMIGLGDDAFEKQGFTLKERSRIIVYCLGEWGGRAMVDGGSILEAATRKQVWALGPDNFEHAGGAAKNKEARETITLPAGSYLVFYSTDSSHSADGWNAPPPYDPDFWGITVWAESEAAAKRVEPYKDDSEANVVLSLIEQGSDADASQGLTVLKPLQVRVYALGEYAGDSFADRGWIEEFKSERRVWDMTERNTEPAGGAEKNRVANEVITLAPGDYVVHYMTDDSHAFDDWNDAAPPDREHWGITLYGTGKFDRTSFKLFDAEARRESGHDYLVRLVRLRDDEEVSSRFKLNKATRVRILAVGEGVDPEMVDYGWIENSHNGDPVWEMTWRNTRFAGGAAKNRKFDGVLLLEAGEYEAHFVTDGSHSWESWNAPKPDDPNLWGITVMVDGK